MISEYTFGGAATRVLIAEDNTLGTEKLARLAIEQEQQLRRKPFRHVIVVTDRSDSGFANLSYHRSFGEWLRNRERSSVSRGAIIEVLGIADSTMLRIRNASGEISERVITGSNCLRFEVKGKKYHIVHVAPWQRFVSGSTNIYFFVRSDSAPTESSVSVLVAELQRRMPMVYFDMYVRPDEWFGSDIHYPFWGPFEEQRAVSPDNDLSNVPSLHCFGTNHGLDCIAHKGV